MNFTRDERISITRVGHSRRAARADRCPMSTWNAGRRFGASVKNVCRQTRGDRSNFSSIRSFPLLGEHKTHSSPASSFVIVFAMCECSEYRRLPGQAGNGGRRNDVNVEALTAPFASEPGTTRSESIVCHFHLRRARTLRPPSPSQIYLGYRRLR